MRPIMEGVDKTPSPPMCFTTRLLSTTVVISALSPGCSFSMSISRPPFSLPKIARSAMVIHSLRVPVMSDNHEVHSPRTGCEHSHRHAALDVQVGAESAPSDVMPLRDPSGAASDTQGVH